jgi:hypothetical protein
MTALGQKATCARVQVTSCGPSLREKVIDVLRRLSKSPLSFQVHAGRGVPITLGIENRDSITAVALVVKYEFVSVIAVRAGCHLDANERIPTRTDTIRALPRSATRTGIW